VTVALGPATLQRVIIDAHEQLEELFVDGTGRIDDLTINASRNDRALKLTGDATARVLRLQGGGFAIHPNWMRPTTVIDLRDAGLENVGNWYERRWVPPVLTDRLVGGPGWPRSTVRPSGTGASGSKRRLGRPVIVRWAASPS
jgi:hypothetical protein